MDTNQMKKSVATTATPTNANAVAPRKPLAPSVLVGTMLGKYKNEIAQALPSVITPERFTRLAVNAIASNPKMVQAVNESPKSLIGALMTCAQLGIEPNTPLGQGYLLPFFNYDRILRKKVMQVTFQLGYQGVIDLCYRSGEVSLIQANVVYSNDDFEYELGLDPKLRHRPFRGSDRGEPIYYYAVFQTKSGAKNFACMSYEEVLEHAKRFSKSYDPQSGTFSGPWQTDFDAMAKKTVLLAALKYAPKKSEFSRQILSDNTVKSVIAKDMGEVPNEVIEADFTDTTSNAEESESGASKTTNQNETQTQSAGNETGFKENE